MVQLTEQERITLLMMIGYGDRRRSFQEASDLFNQSFPARDPISKSTTNRIFHNFEHMGTVKNLPKTGRRKTATNDNKSLDIMLALQEEPMTSVPKLALVYDNSERSIRRILKGNKMRPYKVTLVQELLEDDPERRMQFCQEIMDIIDIQPDFINRILFSDEATFCLNGFVNRHNCRYWSDHNPHWMLEHRTQYPQKLNVWAGIIGNYIIGPFVLHGNLTANSYLDLLQNRIIPNLINLFHDQDNDQILRDDIWFQQDGAPAHFGRYVRDYLGEIFPERWIGRGGSIEWPPRSPDLNPLDFYLWGHLKTEVYRTKPTSLEDLENRIANAVHDITPQHLQNVLSQFSERLGHCQVAEGNQFEHLIK